MDLPFDVLLASAFLASVAGCAIILRLKNFHVHRSVRAGDRNAVQGMHTDPTPRIGGVAIAVVTIATLLYATSTSKPNYLGFSISIIPVFLTGLAEDLGYSMSPRARLLAAAASSSVAVALLGVWMPRVDIPGVDYLIAWVPVGILFTIFATAGICNAFNLIDGLNGLAAGTGIIVALGTAAIASNAGDVFLRDSSYLMVATLTGFLVFNFPWGKIFLGDAGAYSLGHVLSWFAVSLIVRSESVTTWAVLLVFFWPTADTLFAIYRRRKAGKPTDQPDRMHHHQLILRALEILYLGRGKRHVANPLATLVLLPMIAAPAVTGVLLWNQPLASFLAAVAYSGLFIGSYYAILSLATKRARRQPSIERRPQLGQEPGV